MKLILCPDCQDIRALNCFMTACSCGRSWGEYARDGITATYGGNAIPLSIDDASLAGAIVRWRAQDARVLGIRFTASIVGKASTRFKPTN